jgi:transcriptional regulator with XRE-family HTH domain
MLRDSNVIYHSAQGESSHSPLLCEAGNLLAVMDPEIFRQNLLRAMQERGLKAAQLSRLAGLNARAVKDIEEGRALSPKLTTVFALAEALEVDPGELIGLGPRPRLLADLADYLSKYSEADQARLLEALRNLPGLTR